MVRDGNAVEAISTIINAFAVSDQRVDLHTHCLDALNRRRKPSKVHRRKILLSRLYFDRNINLGR